MADPNKILDAFLTKMQSTKFREYEFDKKEIEPSVVVEEIAGKGYRVKVSHGGNFVKMSITKFGMMETDGSQGHRYWRDQVFKIRKSVDKGL